MNISSYKSGRWEQQFQYKSFVPEPINHEWLIDNADIQTLLSDADIKLGELNAFSQLVPDELTGYKRNRIFSFSNWCYANCES